MPPIIFKYFGGDTELRIQVTTPVVIESVHLTQWLSATARDTDTVCTAVGMC